MKKFSIEQLQDRFERLPPELQQAISSADILDSIKTIGKKHGLMIDQLGELVDEIGLVILGLMPSGEFVRNFAVETGTSIADAAAIAKDVNEEIFGKIKVSMRAVEEELQAKRVEQPATATEHKDGTISAIEKAGGFEIEKEPAGADAMGPVIMPVGVINLMKEKELPAPPSAGTPRPEPEKAQPPADLPGAETVEPEPPTDKMLTGLIRGPVAKPTTAEKSLSPERVPPTKGDPYREPLN